ncbi:MAG: adenosylmethionine--8-amino-7-oxononanoate transaminase [Gammaproteobacteria bacterium]|nr:adenosylmethionine--8-amino-7-oxononanoate transaminase [Gammaproteobacteria bacterium]
MITETNFKTHKIWHPCSQMKDYENFPPLKIASARGSYLILEDGTQVLDAISSWWCKNLGHGHPRLLSALMEQTKSFEHVILANTTNKNIEALSSQLTGLTANLRKIFYASEGSSAIEIALKLAVHATELKGQSQKKEIIALSNGYHGETLFAMAVSDLGLYRNAYEHLLPKTNFIRNLPYVNSRKEALWANCDGNWGLIETQLEPLKETTCALILEPIVQGAGGMQVYSQDFLSKLRSWCFKNDVYLIADEIMTGFGRTGKMFAVEHAGIEPDILCLGKGMTGGVLPMSAVLMTDDIYELFYNDYETQKSFLHSHTYSGHALGAAVALECLQVMQDENIVTGVIALEQKLHDAMHYVNETTHKLTNIRTMGGIVAADLIPDGTARQGYEVYRRAVAMGALLRPLGNTIYWLPPLNISSADIEKLGDITIRALT